MSSDILTNVDEQAQAVRRIVDEKFGQAMDYASDAWDTAVNLINQLSDPTLFPTINPAEITYDLPAIDISADVDGERPEPIDPETLIFNVPTIPSKPDFKVYNGSLEPVTKPDISPVLESPRVSDGVNDYIIDLWNVLPDGTGLPVAVEAAIWARALARLELDHIQKYWQIETYFSSRGFDLPPGAMTGALNELTIEILRNNNDINLGIAIEQAKLTQTNTYTILDKKAQISLGIVQNSINAMGIINNTVIGKYGADIDAYKADIQKAVSKMQAEIEVINSFNNTQLESFRVDVEIFKSRLQVESERLNNVIKVYLAKVEIYKADIQVAISKIDAQIRRFEVFLKEVQVQADIALKNAEIEIETSKLIYSIKVEAIKAGAMVTSQLAASAMSSVNASVSSGMSGGAQEGFSYSEGHSFDETKDVKTISESHQHIYNESA
jgi:hypothetical protein